MCKPADRSMVVPAVAVKLAWKVPSAWVIVAESLVEVQPMS